jgi:hypothetical protein
MAEKDGEEQEGPGGRSLKGIAEAGEEETAAGGTKGGQGGSKGSVKDAVSTLVRGPHLKRERGHGSVTISYTGRKIWWWKWKKNGSSCSSIFLFTSLNSFRYSSS